jgi:putative salt-induced outer membrane protein YdiY
MNRQYILIKLIAMFCCGASTLGAGWIETIDGSRINGTIIRIDVDHVHIQTSFAGTIKVPRRQVASLASPHSFHVRTVEGTVMTGPLHSDLAGRLRVGNGRDVERVPLRRVARVWRTNDPDPDAVAAEKATETSLHKWKLRVSADLAGRTGNTQRFSTKLRTDAQREGPHDRLDLYASYDYLTISSLRRSDEIIGGVRFTNFTQGRLGWFVRAELERDSFENIRLRSTNAAGASYRFIQREGLKIEGSSGLGVRYENFYGGAGEETHPGLDLGFQAEWDVNPYGKLKSRVNYLPVLTDFSDFLLDHDTGLEIPLDRRKIWQLRLGLSTKYNSQPDAARKRLDTEYYTRLILSWQ